MLLKKYCPQLFSGAVLAILTLVTVFMACYGEQVVYPSLLADASIITALERTFGGNI